MTGANAVRTAFRDQAKACAMLGSPQSPPTLIARGKGRRRRMAGGPPQTRARRASARRASARRGAAPDLSHQRLRILPARHPDPRQRRDPCRRGTGHQPCPGCSSAEGGGWQDPLGKPPGAALNLPLCPGGQTVPPWPRRLSQPLDRPDHSFSDLRSDQTLAKRALPSPLVGEGEGGGAQSVGGSGKAAAYAPNGSTG